MRIIVLDVSRSLAKPAIEELLLSRHARLALVNGLGATVDGGAALRSIANAVTSYHARKLGSWCCLALHGGAQRICELRKTINYCILVK